LKLGTSSITSNAATTPGPGELLSGNAPTPPIGSAPGCTAALAIWIAPSSLSTSSKFDLPVPTARVSWASGPIVGRPSPFLPEDPPLDQDLRTREHETSVARNGRQAASRGPGCSLPCSHGRNHTRRSCSSMLRAPLPDRLVHLRFRSPVLHARRHQDSCSLRAQGVKVWDRSPEHFL
jgi:hypothetical protein